MSRIRRIGLRSTRGSGWFSDVISGVKSVAEALSPVIDVASKVKSFVSGRGTKQKSAKIKSIVKSVAKKSVAKAEKGLTKVRKAVKKVAAAVPEGKPAMPATKPKRVRKVKPITGKGPRTLRIALAKPMTFLSKTRAKIGENKPRRKPRSISAKGLQIGVAPPPSGVARSIPYAYGTGRMFPLKRTKRVIIDRKN